MYLLFTLGIVCWLLYGLASVVLWLKLSSLREP
jgi:hypothetical protein